MKNLSLLAVFLGLFFNFTTGNAQTRSYDVVIPEFIPANRPFPILVTSRGQCYYPYPESEQPPDIALIGNRLEFTVYLRIFGANINPPPPCVNRTQTYTLPALQPGVYELYLTSRTLNFFNVFGPRMDPGTLIFEVSSAVPITQIPATSGWSLALLLLGIVGVTRWVSGASGR